MKEDYVSFETAKLLKEKGFNAFTQTGWEAYDNKKEPRNFIPDNGRGGWYDTKKEWLSRPTLQMVMKWLREIHNIHIEVEVYYCEEGQMWLAKIQKIESANTILVKTCMVNNTYEEAVESAIKYCLTNLI